MNVTVWNAFFVSIVLVLPQIPGKSRRLLLKAGLFFSFFFWVEGKKYKKKIYLEKYLLRRKEP